jgi:hypothetical protein
MEHYTSYKILAVYRGEEAWENHLPIRWTQASVRADVQRRFRRDDKSHGLLVIFVDPKEGEPIRIGIHYYSDERIPGFAGTYDGENKNAMITEAPYEAVYMKDTPQLIKDLCGVLD